ncbi:hypothetical protein Tco_1537890 [Tanacetum coccineum]
MSRCLSTMMRESVFGGSGVIMVEHVMRYYCVAKEYSSSSSQEMVRNNSFVDIEKSREDPYNLHNKEIVVENSVKFVDNNQSFDWNTGPDYRQTGLEVDNRNHDGHRSYKTHKSMARIRVVEVGMKNREDYRTNSELNHK